MTHDHHEVANNTSIHREMLRTTDAQKAQYSTAQDAASCNRGNTGNGYTYNNDRHTQPTIPSLPTPTLPSHKHPLTELSADTTKSTKKLPSPTYKTGRRAGFPRPRSTDKQQYLSRAQFRGLLNASRFADHRATPFTAHVTIRWSYAPGFEPEKLNTYQTDLFRSLRSWLARRKIPFVYAYTIERADKVGIHTHCLFHLPPDRWLSLRDGLEAHLRKAGSFNNPAAMRVTPGNGKPAISENQRRGLLRYISKALSPTELTTNGSGLVPLVDLLGIKPEPGLPLPPGIKRAGWSQNIGIKAREAAGWHELHELAEITPNFDSMGRRIKTIIRKASQENRAERMAREAERGSEEEREAA
jgi:hypothetical protein